MIALNISPLLQRPRWVACYQELHFPRLFCSSYVTLLTIPTVSQKHDHCSDFAFAFLRPHSGYLHDKLIPAPPSRCLCYLSPLSRTVRSHLLMLTSALCNTLCLTSLILCDLSSPYQKGLYVIPWTPKITPCMLGAQ